MKYNVVFLGIGTDSCGDAIVIRMWDGNDEGTQRVIVIDGGYKEDWRKVEDIVKNKFGAAWIDLVVSSHPDRDHIAGLPGVVENMEVKKLWMHLPWDHSDDYLAYRQDEFNSMKATQKLKNSLQSSNDLALAADTNKVWIEEPFAGKQFISPFGVMTVLSPTEKFYEGILPQIIDKSANKASTQTLGLVGALEQLIQNTSSVIASKLEDHNIETLSNSGTTSPSNNTSTVMLLELVSGEKLLFTGDAGLEALDLAHQSFTALGHAPGEISLIQVPHHGSRQNVGPNILDRFLGGKTTAAESGRRGTAYVSAALNCTKDGHPKKSVANAFRRRGYPVFQTASRALKHGHDLIGFSGSVDPLPHFTEVEGD